jgi:predicted MFS family arabinose efflux permease
VAPRVGGIRARLGRYPPPVPLLVVGQALLATGSGVVFPFLSLFATTVFGVDVATAGVVASVYFLAGIPAAPLAGVTADRVGRRPVLVAAVLGFAASMAAIALAPTLTVLAAAAAGAGFAVACIHPVNSAVVADVVATERRGQAYGVLYQALGLGWFLGPLVAAPFLAAGGYRLAFGVVAVAVALAGCLYAVRLPETRPPSRRPDGPGEVRPAPAAAGRGWWRDPRLLTYAGLHLLTFGAYLELFIIFPVDANERLGLEPGTWAVVIALNGLLILAGQGVVSRAVRGFNRPTAVAGGVLLWAIGFAVLALQIPLPVLVAAMVVLTVGEMVVIPLQPAVVADLAPPEARARYQGVLSFGGAIGNAVAPLVAGTAVAAIGGAWWTVMAVGLVGLAAAYVAFGRVVRPGERRSAPAAPAAPAS